MAEYVEYRKSEYYVAGTRVPLECVVQEFLGGATPEAIYQAYPALTPEKVCGAISYYLGHQSELDEHFRAVDQQYEAFRAAQPPVSADLRDRIERARQHLLSSRS